MSGAEGFRVDAGLCFEKLVLVLSGCVVVPGKVGEFLVEVGGGLEVFDLEFLLFCDFKLSYF